MAEAAEFQGARSAPARQWLRRGAALLAGAPLIVGLLQLSAAGPVRADGGATGSRTVDVSLDTLSPTAPTKSDTLSVTGRVTNDGDSTITGAHVGLRLGSSPLSGPSAIDDAAKRTGFSYIDGTEISGKHIVKIAKLAPGVSRSFSITVPVNDLGLGSAGVYQLGVSLSGQTQAQRYDQVLGIERTFLPWQPSAAAKKTKLTFMWPLISSTHLTAETGADEAQTPIFKDDKLAAELAPGGRLQQLVSLGKNLPVTWVVDPDLLATVDAMTHSYKVGGPDNRTAGKNQAVARKWMSDLQNAVEGGEVVALPFADPDLASIAHRGKKVSGTLGQLQPATDRVSATVGTTLQVKPRTDFAWPVDGAVDPSIIDVATSAGAHTVIARSDSFRETGGLPYTPTAARPIGGGNTAVVADARLSRAFQGDMTRAGNSTSAVQKFLAQTLAITQQTNKQRSIVVAPQRMPSASQAQAMAQALRGLESGRWTEPLSLGNAAKAKPDPGATRRVPGSASYPASLRKQELPTQAFRETQETQKVLESFKKILSEKDRVVTPFGNAISRDLSTEWRGDPRGSQKFRNSVRAYLMGLTKKVSLIQKSAATLSGRSATIPVTVQNNLVQQVKNLDLVLTSNQPNRLDPGDPQPVTIEGGHSQSVKFETTANANGPVQVTAQLYTKDGTPYGAPMIFEVEATEITATVMLVIAGGLLLLVLAGVRLYLQRKRAVARKAANQEGDDGAGSGTADNGGGGGTDSDDDGEDASPDDDGPGQLGDPSADTGSESAGPSGSGEKVDR
ncbi:DUF6049 family protein [Streptomyces sp. H27-D2]|uniref:DUF6049 family protein n=1 Tax=Streptomyces sp. H27-D2 TaxID=3046304 RepID=UPI002DBFD809|nr:DUF6049 family protein [Streptomyces sp. H27-D2]MEC4015751.1 DUF6049 family protein [Streptomyces sp. H27-D2]